MHNTKNYIISALAVFAVTCSMFLKTLQTEPDISARYIAGDNETSPVVTEYSETAGVTKKETCEVTGSHITAVTSEVSKVTGAITDISCVITSETEEFTVSDTSEVTTDTMEEETVHGVISGEMLADTDYYEYQLPENPDYSGFKSYEPYYLITSQSVQLYLQYDAVTDDNGFRLLDGRYLVAVGTFCNAPCGTYIDLILENGVLIPCIVGDIKADAHTDDTHAYTRASMCASEFIIDDEICPAVWSGDISKVYDEWNARVQMIRVYNKNYNYI